MPLEDVLANGWKFVDDSRPPAPPPRFTEAQIAEKEERRRLAKASPLRKGMSLSFALPSIYPDAVFDGDRNSTDSPNPLRKPSKTVLRFLQASESSKAQVKLLKGIQKGKDNCSQIWSAEIDVGGKQRKIVVKLHAEALFPLPSPPPYDTHWDSADIQAKQEAEAYSFLRSRQGTDIPICYGFFNFSSPWGETVVGAILEDLNEIGITVWDWGKKYLEGGHSCAKDVDSDQESISTRSSDSEEKEMSVEEAEKLAEKLKYFIHELFKAQRRIHDLGHTAPITGFVLHSSSIDKPHFVFVGFSYTFTRAVKEQRHQRRREEVKRIKGSQWADVMNPDFRANSEWALTDKVGNIFGETVWRCWRNKKLFEFAESV